MAGSRSQGKRELLRSLPWWAAMLLVCKPTPITAGESVRSAGRAPRRLTASRGYRERAKRGAHLHGGGCAPVSENHLAEIVFLKRLHARLGRLNRGYCRHSLRVGEAPGGHWDGVNRYLRGKLTVVGDPVGSVSLYPGYRVSVSIVLSPRTIRRDHTGAAFPGALPAAVTVNMVR